MNAAFGTVSGSVASVGSGAWAAPGLLAPEAMTLAFSGMTVTVGLPSPWGLISSSGIVVRAHGTQTNQDTQNYSVAFNGFVPASGSVTAYLAATIQLIQQNPVSIPGPPQGHPSYNPSFVPTVGYATNVLSIALAAVTGGVDNVNTFELFRTTLTAGQTGLTTVSTAGWVRAADRRAWPTLSVSSGGTLVPAQAYTVISPSASGLTHTLPPASGCGGLIFGFINPTTGNETVATSGSDVIAGSGTTGLSSIAIPPSGTLELYTSGGTIWRIMAFSPNMVPPPPAQAPGLFLGTQYFSGNATYTPTPGMTTGRARGVGSGGPGSGCSATAGTVGVGSSGTAATYAEAEFTAAQIGASKAVVIGAAVAGGRRRRARWRRQQHDLGWHLTCDPRWRPGGALVNQAAPTAAATGSSSSDATVSGGVVLLVNRTGTVAWPLGGSLDRGWLGRPGGDNFFGAGGATTKFNTNGANAVRLGRRRRRDRLQQFNRAERRQ